jgi:hypothetical protein
MVEVCNADPYILVVVQKVRFGRGCLSDFPVLAGGDLARWPGVLDV